MLFVAVAALDKDASASHPSLLNVCTAAIVDVLVKLRSTTENSFIGTSVVDDVNDVTGIGIGDNNGGNDVVLLVSSTNASSASHPFVATSSLAIEGPVMGGATKSPNPSLSSSFVGMGTASVSCC